MGKNILLEVKYPGGQYTSKQLFKQEIQTSGKNILFKQATFNVVIIRRNFLNPRFKKEKKER